MGANSSFCFIVNVKNYIFFIKSGAGGWAENIFAVSTDPSPSSLLSSSVSSVAPKYARTACGTSTEPKNRRFVAKVPLLMNKLKRRGARLSQ